MVLTAARAAARSHARTRRPVITYLEINCLLLSLGGLNVLIDPLLEGPLDFGLPEALYSASKRSLPPAGLVDALLPELDAVIISQGLDDHAHERTLRKMASLGFSAPIIAPPSAKRTLLRTFPESQVRWLRPGEQTRLQARADRVGKEGGGGIDVRACSGALVGPPWQARENGYVLRGEGGFSVYYEPHVEFDVRELRSLAPVDAVVTPIVGQTLPGFELVHGPRAALRLVEVLRPRTVLPLANGEIDASGITAALVSQIGDNAEFARLLRQRDLMAEVCAMPPGEPVDLV